MSSVPGVIIMYDMRSGTKGRDPAPAPIFLRMTADDRLRLKIACAEDGVSYLGFVRAALDNRDKARRRAATMSSSPLHVDPVAVTE